jgi:hypothetical protein
MAGGRAEAVIVRGGDRLVRKSAARLVQRFAESSQNSVGALVRAMTIRDP